MELSSSASEAQTIKIVFSLDELLSAYYSYEHFMHISVLAMKPKLKDLNENITCSICFGYLIDATTVIECLCTCEFIIIHKFLCLCMLC